MLLSEQAKPIEPPFLVSIDGEPPIAWEDFCEANADAFGPDELAIIGADVRRDGIYLAGGGAVPDVEIRLAASPLTFD